MTSPRVQNCRFLDMFLRDQKCFKGNRIAEGWAVGLGG